MKEEITRLLNESVTAPSPDNYQPWRFEVRGNDIEVYKVPKKVNAMLDSRQHVLLLTNGMLIENIEVAATHYGFRAGTGLFPDSARPDLVARISLSKDHSVKSHPLYPFLNTRCTNRKLYSKDSIPQAVLDELSAPLVNFPGIEMQFLTGQPEIKKLGKAVSAIDKIMCENKQLHEALFQHITWTVKEEQETHQGLSLDSMELNAVEKQLFRAIRNWPVINALNKIGFANVIRSQNAAQYGSAGCSVIISTRNDGEADYVEAGRFIQHFWLAATQKKLSLHPVVGVIYCTQKISDEKETVFTSGQAALLRESYDVLDSIASSHGKTNPHIVFFFRMGYAKPTGYKSTRKKAQIIFRD
jgi:hypothetical protein